MQTPALLPFPDLTEPQVAFPLYTQPELEHKYITRLENIYLQARDSSEDNKFTAAQAMTSCSGTSGSAT